MEVMLEDSSESDSEVSVAAVVVLPVQGVVAVGQQWGVEGLHGCFKWQPSLLHCFAEVKECIMTYLTIECVIVFERCSSVGSVLSKK